MNRKICIVGLGYVGLPLAVEFGKISKVIGFDINQTKINEITNFKDSMGEVSEDELRKADIEYTSDQKRIREADFLIIAVPTPVTTSNVPDMKYVESASEVVGKNLSKGAIVVYESTVYPGVTEEICVPILEKFSGLKCGKDFKIGYSPERVNPGDKEHTIDKIIKVVSGMDEESLSIITYVYSQIIKAGIFKAANIKTAEAAKVIENIQRDLNVALMNELCLIFSRMGIRTKDVLDAAATKWNFHRYHPGLVGGHCIGVDPYYLTYKAQELGYDPQVILAGRKINNYMATYVAELVIKALNQANKVPKQSTVLIMGLTFKENVRDSRNSKAKDVIEVLKRYGITVLACDPKLEQETVEKEFNVKNYKFNEIKQVDCVILISTHKEFKSVSILKLKELMGNKPALVDIKNFYDRDVAERLGFIYYSL